MFAKYKINLKTLTIGATATTINIPLTLEHQLIDQNELINTKFVNVEVENAINPILDYEKTRFIPSGSTGIVNKITYALTFINNANNFESIGFTNDDIKFRKNNFKLSFLNLKFYDSPNATDQRLISIITLYPKITLSNLDLNGNVNPANKIPIIFTVSNPLKNPRGIFEGYHIYHYKDEVNLDLPKELYMKANFNNAKTGKSTNLMTENEALSIDKLVNKLYTKYILIRNNTGYYYEIDSTYSNNVIIDNDNITINLYQIQAL